MTHDGQELTHMKDLPAAINRNKGIPFATPTRTLRMDIYATITAVQRNPSNSWTITTLADLAHLSRSAFHRAFMREVGLTPMAWLCDVRVNEMARLLAETNDSVRVIARKVGWKRRAHASRQFKARTGMTPSQYRVATGNAGGKTCPLCGKALSG
ncbi:hypothetical protein DCC26_04245 [Auritidibacter sp. NML120779]|uniref:helix-turn-helix transcriptional regulator n=2 Tax=Auritidibacter ignavus TaxID=678932 RepID=UPI000D7267A8|nr:hypothetical protein DCC26_04245 [Auritidibacter sp. NML120779]